MQNADRSQIPLLALVLAFLRHRLALSAASLKPRHRAADIAALSCRDSAPPGG